MSRHLFSLAGMEDRVTSRHSLAPITGDICEDLIREERLLRLQDLLRDLSDEDRLLLESFQFEENSRNNRSSLAKMLGVGTSTVDRRRRTLLLRLQRAMETS